MSEDPYFLRRDRDPDTGPAIYGGMPYHIFEFVWCDRHVDGVDGGLDELQRARLRTYLMNGDQESAFKFLAEIRKLRIPEPPPKTCEIASFVPGTHHYVLGVKFDTEVEARAHAIKKGYRVTRVFHVDGSGQNAAALKEVLRKRED
jgi:hypothetical protein